MRACVRVCVCVIKGTKSIFKLLSFQDVHYKISISKLDSIKIIRRCGTSVFLINYCVFEQLNLVKSEHLLP